PEPEWERAAAGRRGGLSRRVGGPPIGSAAATGAEDGGARDLGRGHCPRLQQYSRGGPQLYRIGAGRGAAGQSRTVLAPAGAHGESPRQSLSAADPRL